MRQVQEAEDEKEEQSTSNLLLDFICYDDRRPSLREWRPESQHFYPYFPPYIHFGMSCMLPRRG